jgi:hypothetical protein
MRGGGARGALPLRAMLQGELLDTAVALFRTRALPLLAMAVPLLAIEQLVLWRAGAPGLDEYAPFTYWWRVIATLFACEGVIVLLLGAYAGAAAGPALLGEQVSHRALFRRVRPLPLLATALVPALVAWPGAYFGFVGWVVAYGFLGLAGVALVIDRARWPLGALGRSVRLASRLGGRGFWLRLWAGLIWLGIRVALAIGPITFLWQAGLVADGYLGAWPVLMMWGLAGTVSAATLACFDAAVLIDTRIRTEGLDVELRRAQANGADAARVLVHSRRGRAAPGAFPAQPAVPPWPLAFVRPPVPTGLSRQAQLQWMQAQAQAQHQEQYRYPDRPDRGRES